MSDIMKLIAEDEARNTANTARILAEARARSAARAKEKENQHRAASLAMQPATLKRQQGYQADFDAYKAAEASRTATQRSVQNVGSSNYSGPSIAILRAAWAHDKSAYNWGKLTAHPQYNKPGDPDYQGDGSTAPASITAPVSNMRDVSRPAMPSFSQPNQPATAFDWSAQSVAALPMAKPVLPTNDKPAGYNIPGTTFSMDRTLEDPTDKYQKNYDGSFAKNEQGQWLLKPTNEADGFTTTNVHPGDAATQDPATIGAFGGSRATDFSDLNAEPSVVVMPNGQPMVKNNGSNVPFQGPLPVSTPQQVGPKPVGAPAVVAPVSKPGQGMVSTPDPKTKATMVVERQVDPNDKSPVPIAAPGAKVSDDAFDTNIARARDTVVANAANNSNSVAVPQDAPGANVTTKAPLVPTAAPSPAILDQFKQLDSALNGVVNPYARQQYTDANGNQVFRDSDALAAIKGQLIDTAEEQSRVARAGIIQNAARHGIAGSGIEANQLGALRMQTASERTRGLNNATINAADKGAAFDLQKAQAQDAFQSTRFNALKESLLLPEELAAQRNRNAGAPEALKQLQLSTQNQELVNTQLTQAIEQAKKSGDWATATAIGQLLGVLGTGAIGWLTGGASAILPALSVGAAAFGGAKK